MSAGTSIEWTDATWNPTRGCSRVSPGCVNCYAERMAARMSTPGMWGHGLARMTKAGPRWTGKVELIPEALTIPLHWRKGRLIFVNSTSDLFHESLPDEIIDQVFAAMVLGWWHTYQVLTKRAERAQCYLSNPSHRLRWLNVIRTWSALRTGWLGGYVRANGWPTLNPDIGGDSLAHVWLGVSVENQEQLRRIDHLKDTPAAVRFVSFEPLLESLGAVLLGGIQWAIIGGESGPGARPCSLRWVRSLAAQCKAEYIPVFVKQLGSRPCVPACASIDCTHPDCSTEWLRLNSSKGGDMAEWPADLRLREFPR